MTHQGAESETEMTAHRNGRWAFEPAWWLRGGHAQTLYAAIWRQRWGDLVLRRDCWDLPDGDFLDLRWADLKPASGGLEDRRRPIVLLLHGLEGSYRSAYVGGMMRAIQQRGWRPLLIHFRGCGDELNRLPHSYHSGHTKDLAHVVEQLRRREGPVPIAAIGYSLGGNVLLKYLADAGDASPLAAAAAVSVPFDLACTADRVTQGMSRLYQWYLLQRLRRTVRRKLVHHRQAFRVGEADLGRLTTFRRFDDHITAPLHGFVDAEDYYRRCSSGPMLGRITTPTLLIHARNDPLVSPAAVPDPAGLPACVRLELSDDGGHVGFISGGQPWAPDFYLERRIPDQFATHFGD